MFSRLRTWRCVAAAAAAAYGAAIPLTAAGAGSPSHASSAAAALAPVQSAPWTGAKASVCVGRELVASWDRPEDASKMSAFKDALAAYIRSRRDAGVQYLLPPFAFLNFDARNPGALAIETARAGQPCPGWSEEYTITLDPSPADRAAAPAVSGDAAARCNALASDPGDPFAAGGGAPNGQININEALPVCEAAASARPFVPRSAFLYGRVLEEAGREAEAVRQFAIAAQAGEPNAAHALAGLYYEGRGVTRSLEQAIRYCRQAADGGVPGALYRMGFLYLWGEGVSKDLTQAAAWFRKAGDAGFADAYGYLGRTYAIGNPPDFATAARWFRYAADKGSAVGALNLGYLSEAGRGVPRDDAQAVAWFRRAAEHNDPNAMRQLGLHLREGRGVRWSEAEAMEWFGKAARQGDLQAESLMAYGYMHGLGNDAGQGRQDYGEAARLFGHAAAAGDPVAQLDLGVLYANGWGVAQDVPRARSLFTQAVNSGVPEVAARARQLSAQLAAPPTAAQPRSGGSDSSWVGPAIGIGVVALIGYALFHGGSSSGSSSDSYAGGSDVWQDPMSSNYGNFMFSCTVGGGSINVFGDCSTPAGIAIPAPR